MAILELYLLSQVYRRKSGLPTGTPYRNEQFASDGNNVLYYVLITFYIIITLYVAIAFPLAGNVAVSLIMAIFLTPIFWIFKIIELLVYASKKGLRNKNDNRVGKNKR